MNEFDSIVFATGNDHKAKEVREILDQKNLIFETLADIGFHSEIEETGSTLTENALIKARTIFNSTGRNVFADDSGLEVWSLDMGPGVHTARYGGPQKNADDNMDKLLKSLQGQDLRKARFRTVIALIWNGKEHLFEGIVNGNIGYEKIGEGGFGYDPIFIPDGHELTFAQIPNIEKNKISHRFNAVKAMKDFMDKL